MVVVPNILRELKARVVDYHQKVKWGVFCLIFCFTIGKLINKDEAKFHFGLKKFKLNYTIKVFYHLRSVA